MQKHNRYLEFVVEQLSPLGEITSKNMFGGYCLYCGGVVFALIAKDALYLKVDDRNRSKFEARGLQPFHPFDDPKTSMNYYQAPAEMFEHPDCVREWAGSAVEAGRRKKPKRRPKSS